MTSKFWGLRVDVPYEISDLTHFWREKPTDEQLKALQHGFTPYHREKLLNGELVKVKSCEYCLEEQEFQP